MSTVQEMEDQTYVFQTTAFASANFAGVQITSLPTTGTLYVNGAAATLNQIVFASTVAAGNFTFVPNTDVTAPGSFNDVVGTSSNGTLTKPNSSVTLNVAAPDGPSASPTSSTGTDIKTYSSKNAGPGS